MRLGVTVREGRGLGGVTALRTSWPGPAGLRAAVARPRGRQVAVLPRLRGGAESPPPALPPSRLLSLSSCSSSQRPPALPAAVSPAPPRRCLRRPWRTGDPRAPRSVLALPRRPRASGLHRRCAGRARGRCYCCCCCWWLPAGRWGAPLSPGARVPACGSPGSCPRDERSPAFARIRRHEDRSPAPRVTLRVLLRVPTQMAPQPRARGAGHGRRRWPVRLRALRSRSSARRSCSRGTRRTTRRWCTGQERTAASS